MLSGSKRGNLGIQMTKSIENSVIGKRRRMGSVGCADEPLDSQVPVRTATSESLCGDRVAKKHNLDPTGPESPDAFLRQLVSSQFGIDIDDTKMPSHSSSPDFFDTISEEEMSNYTAAVANAVRGNNIEEMTKLQQAGVSLNCCNRFGESLLHIACRRGFSDIVRLILDQEGVSVRLSDDCGRNPLHDLCWNPTPQLEICQWILEKEPILFFLRDKRNFTPFDYARQEHWPVWKKFIVENKGYFQALDDESFGNFLRNKKEASTADIEKI